ncbi:polyisoprenoid-binding protein YceI [Algoriphagus sp. 4150]|uniref:YceI family protein n=1 Tax=Algoriphagus sp. 4150 TaxID=2817756 RepID=UPI0028636009|nr:YceI family protein [Algoriphagus sp. 4150]MDR7128721.1 polyisoprenoid-binding protein YceI [Algoriphagus sp. 4150]
MKRLVLLSFLLFHVLQVHCQSLRSESGYVRFFSSALVEDITATNNKATAVFDPVSGEAVFLIPIAAFEFRKSLMKEHFNENYLESEKFPEAYFRGKISGYIPEKPQSNAVAEGELTIHGVTKPVKIQGTITDKGGKIGMQAVFKVVLKDYNVEIPRLMFQNIAEEVEVTIKFEFKNQN